MAPRVAVIIFGAAAAISIAVLAIAVHSSRLSLRASVLVAAAAGGNTDQIKYVYLPAAIAKEAPRERSATLNALLTQSLDDNLGDGLGNNKSCAISSLIAQANFIFPHWDGCGYIHHAKTQRRGVISGPAHDMFCGPDEMRMWPCDVKYVRTYKDGNPGNLGNCYARIPGLSQTCKYYQECGTRTSPSDWNKDVCDSDTGDYYKEPEVQRMCGICQMFTAELADSRETPDEFGKKKEGGCIADSGEVTRRRNGGNATRVRVGELRVDDEVWTPGGYRRVYYVKAHKEAVGSVRLEWQDGSVETSRHHLLPVADAARFEAREGAMVPCPHGAGVTLKAAADVTAHTDALLLPPAGSPGPSPEREGLAGCRLAPVRRRVERVTKVRYVLVEGDYLAVGGALVSVYSSPLAAWEALPFRALDVVFPGSLQWAAVEAALGVVLESPLLLAAEALCRAVSRVATGVAVRKSAATEAGPARGQRRAAAAMAHGPSPSA